MLFKKLSLILFLIIFSNVKAQTFELGEVSIPELQEKVHPKDSSAVAAILFKKGETRIEYFDNEGFVMLTVVKTRIKVYKKEGYNWANQKVNYYVGTNSKETVSFSDAFTYNLDDEKIEKTKLKSDGEFIEKINKYWSQKKITMPNVKEGSVMEFEYQIRYPLTDSPISELFREWYFQTSIPVNYSEFKTYIPEYFFYNLNQKGFIFPKVTKEIKPKSIVLSNRQNTVSIGSFGGEFSNLAYHKIDYFETITTYMAENLPAMKEEEFVNNLDNYTSSISHELSMIKIPNTSEKTFSTDWQTVTKKIYDYEDFGPELNKTGYFEQDINALIKATKTQGELIVAIFNFVKSNVKWNYVYGYLCNDGVKTAYKNRTGNVAEINLMLISMLRFAGINANPVLVSTKSNGIAFFPKTSAFNYVIAAVETPEGLILLDATEKYAEPNILPLRDLNWVGRLIRKDGTSTEVNLMPKTLSKEATNMNFVLKNDGSVIGKIRKQFTDQEALEFRNENLVTNQDSYVEKLENENDNIEISDYIRENDLDSSKPIVESYSFKDTKNVEIINDKMYISPLLFMTTKENPFKQEVREYPVDFGYPLLNKCSISIEIPAGYSVESMPASVNIGTGEGTGSFKFIIANTGNLIQLASTTTINSAIVSPDFYPILKGFFQQMIDKQNEKIILTKIQ
jgi:hypothetical protein